MYANGTLQMPPPGLLSTAAASATFFYNNQPPSLRFASISTSTSTTIAATATAAAAGATTNATTTAAAGINTLLYNNGSVDSYDLEQQHIAEEEDYIFERIEVKTALILAYTFVFFCCFVGNLLVILVVVLHRRMRTITNFFLANLAFADLCVGVFCVYQNLSQYLIASWLWGEFLCKMYHFVQTLAYTASIAILMLLAVERYLAIIHPIRSKQILTLSRLKMVIALVWVASAAYSSPRLVMYGTITFPAAGGGTETICILRRGIYDSRVYDSVNFAVCFLLPLCVISAIYVRIGVELWHSKGPLKLPNKKSKASAAKSKKTGGVSVSVQQLHEQNSNHHGGNHHNHHQQQLLIVTPPNEPEAGDGGAGGTNGGNEHEMVLFTKKLVVQEKKATALDCCVKANADERMPTAVTIVVDLENRKTTVPNGCLLRSPPPPGGAGGGGASGTNIAATTYDSTSVYLQVPDGGGSKKDNGGAKRLNSWDSDYTDDIVTTPTSNSAGSAGRPRRSPSSASDVIIRARRKVIRMLIALVLSFALCNLPFHARKMWQYWSPSYEGASETAVLLTPATFLAMYLNAGLNPLLYAFLSRHFRQSMHDVLVCRGHRPRHFRRQSSSRSTMRTQVTSCTNYNGDC